MQTVTVSASALRELLNALNSSGPQLRELMALRGPLVGDDNPINILVQEFNAAVVANNAPDATDAKVDATGALTEAFTGVFGVGDMHLIRAALAEYAENTSLIEDRRVRASAIWDHLGATCSTSPAAPGPMPQAELRPVEGDLLPPVGSKVFIHLNSLDRWIEHTVTGYYAWADLHGDPALSRVFVMVIDHKGYPNSRLLQDVRLDPKEPMAFVTRSLKVSKRYIDGVECTRLAEALTWMGCKCPESQEGLAAGMPDYVNQLTRAILHQKKSADSQEAVGWMIYSADGEKLLLEQDKGAAERRKATGRYTVIPCVMTRPPPPLALHAARQSDSTPGQDSPHASQTSNL